MPDVSKLKKKAAELELKKQFDKALVVYVEILDSYDESIDEVDVALFNRVGDLYLKQGNVADAVDYYEQAVDRYAEGGFFNNAIALCNKILRNSPGRATVYYKLGRISAQKGFKSDAKANFLEYADRMQQAGEIDEAFRALKEFADLCPDQDDIRLMLAEQLTKKQRGPEAIEQLQLLYDRYAQQGRSLEARATIDRMKAIDEEAAPRPSAATPSRSQGDLVFLDLTLGPPTTGEVRVHTPRASAVVPMIELAAAAGLEPALLDGVTRSVEFDGSTGPVGGVGALDGLETTAAGADDADLQDAGGGLLDLEPTAFVPPTTPVAPADGLLELELPDGGDFDPGSVGHVPGLEVERSEVTSPPSSLRDFPLIGDDEPAIGGDLELIMPDSMRVPAASNELDDIPVFDLDLPLPGEAAGSLSARNGAVPGEIELIDLDDDFGGGAPTPPRRRSSTLMAAQSVELLQALAEADPDDNALRRRLGEAMLDSGDRDGGVRELEAAMVGYERADNLAMASALADEIVLLNPGSVRHHQKRVEYAFRTNEPGRLVEAYLELANALFAAGQIEKSRSIYHRVLDLAPDEYRARDALDSFATPEAPPPAVPAMASRRPSASVPTAVSVEPAVSAPAASSDEQYVNLGDWLRDDEAPKDTRMIVEEQEPTGDEEADFQDMLKKFKQGIAENVEEEDHQSHYDLGVAYKEMGLLDEAIAEFQKALRAPKNRVPTYEALGACFLEKAQLPMAATILSRALHEPGTSDDQLVGVLYLLGSCAEQRGQRAEAIEFYQRVFVVDIQFRDVGDRLAAVEGAEA